MSFSMLRHWIPAHAKPPVYWQGDDVDIAVIGSDKYKKKSEKRASELQRFLGPDGMIEAVAK